MVAPRPRVLLLSLALAAAGCQSSPENVLQTDLPQIPGMVGRQSTGLEQSHGMILAGTFAYKGDISDLGTRMQETTARFAAAGWLLESERRTEATAHMTFVKGMRRANVELIRNDLAPSMSTAVTKVHTATETPRQDG